MTLLRNDRKLLERFRLGDREALSEVYWYYVALVEQVARRGVTLSGSGSVSGVPSHEVSDLVQETFTRAFAERARLSYDGLRDYRPFLLTICRNLLIDWAKKRGREIPVALDPDAAFSDIAPGAQHTEPWADAPTMAIVETYVKSLEPPLSLVYELRFVKGLSQAAAAASLNLGRQTIRTLENRLRKGIQVLL